MCAATVEELDRAFNCAVAHVVSINGDKFVLRSESSAVRTSPNWSQRIDAGILGRCIQEGRSVLVAEVNREPQYRGTDATRDIRSELAVPIIVAGKPWGVINLEDVSAEAFSPDDARLLESVAAQVGGALNSINLYEQLDRAYMQTAEALSEALEAKDSYTAEHSRSIADNAAAVGKLLGMKADELRMLRYAAAFHDIGKLAISQEILSKPAALTSTSARRSNSTPSSASASSLRSSSSRRSARSSAAPTSAGTVAATRTVSPARTSRSPLASSSPATPTTR